MERLPELKTSLINTELAHLRVIARLWGVDVQASRPLEIAAELARFLSDPAHASDTWETLSQEERNALKALLDAGGKMPAAAFKRSYGDIRSVGPGRLEREAPWRDPISPAESLWYRGLIYAGFFEEGGETFPIYFIPGELQLVLPEQAYPPAKGLQIKPVAPPAQQHAGGVALLDDVTTTLSFIHNEIVRPNGASIAKWPDGTMRKLAGFLRERNAARLDFILQLVDQLGWARLSDDGRLRLVPEPVMAWLQESAGKSLTLLVDAWRQMGDWNELTLLTTLQPVDTGTWRSDPKLARTALVRHLGSLEPGIWVRIADFTAAVKVNDPDFLRPGGDYEQWYVRETSTGTYLTGFASWDQVEGVLLHALLTGPAWWLGLVDLGEDVPGGVPELFRTSPPGRTIPLSEPSVPVVRPDLTVVMPSERRLGRFQLARVADLVAAEDRFVYRFTPASLRRARLQRIDLDKVLSFLDGLSDAPVPKSVHSTLTRWAERGTEVWLEHTVLVRVTDEAVMEQIKSSPRTGRYIGRIISPTVAAVAERDLYKLVAGLAELGLLAEVVTIRDS